MVAQQGSLHAQQGCLTYTSCDTWGNVGGGESASGIAAVTRRVQCPSYGQVITDHESLMWLWRVI